MTIFSIIYPTIQKLTSNYHISIGNFGKTIFIWTPAIISLLKFNIKNPSLVFVFQKIQSSIFPICKVILIATSISTIATGHIWTGGACLIGFCIGELFDLNLLSEDKKSTIRRLVFPIISLSSLLNGSWSNRFFVILDVLDFFTDKRIKIWLNLAQTIPDTPKLNLTTETLDQIISSTLSLGIRKHYISEGNEANPDSLEGKLRQALQKDRSEIVDDLMRSVINNADENDPLIKFLRNQLPNFEQNPSTSKPSLTRTLRKIDRSLEHIFFTEQPTNPPELNPGAAISYAMYNKTFHLESIWWEHHNQTRVISILETLLQKDSLARKEYLDWCTQFAHKKIQVYTEKTRIVDGEKLSPTFAKPFLQAYLVHLGILEKISAS